MPKFSKVQRTRPIPRHKKMLSSPASATVRIPRFRKSSSKTQLLLNQSVANPYLLLRLRTSLSDCWERLDENDQLSRASLSILHGLAERLAKRSYVQAEVIEFFEKRLRLLAQKALEPTDIENDANKLGLPILDPEEDVREISAFSGVVESVSEDQQARVVLLDDTNGQILDDITVPINWIPLAYREEGAGVYWVERRYGSGVKGRFEPGSARA